MLRKRTQPHKDAAWQPCAGWDAGTMEVPSWKDSWEMAREARLFLSLVCGCRTLLEQSRGNTAS